MGRFQFTNPPIPNFMLRNYLRVALRILWKQKTITAINVLGLAAGMAVCLLVGLLLWDQVTHDTFHPDGDRIHRVTTVRPGQSTTFASSPAGLAPVLRNEVAGVEAATRIRQADGNVITENHAFEAEALYADGHFFALFGFELTRGNKATALSAPQTAVISEQLAHRLFGDSTARGRTFEYGDRGVFTVTGIMDRDAYRSHLHFDALYSYATLQRSQPDALASDWNRALTDYTYLRLSPGTPPEDLRSTLQTIQREQVSWDSAQGPPPIQLNLQALSDLPLDPLSTEIAEGLLPPFVAYFLGVLALLVLLAAGFNYINLSTARSLTRAREVGIRKTIGAYRMQMVGQFIAESVVVSLLALGLSLLFLQFLVPAFNGLWIVHELNARIDVAPGPWMYLAALGFAILVAIVAGLYPAWHLSRFQPVQVLKTSTAGETPGFEWMTPRKILIVFQLAVAIVVVLTTIFAYQQAGHMGEANVGFNTDNLVHLELQDAPFALVQQEAERLSGVERVAAANAAPLSGARWGGTLYSDRMPDSLDVGYYAVSPKFIATMNIPLVAAEDQMTTAFEGGRGVLVNETTIQRLGFQAPREALGHEIRLASDTTDARIIGVIRDVHFQFTQTPNQPVVLDHDPRHFRVALAEIGPGRRDAAVAALAETWRSFDDRNPLRVRYYEAVIGDQYQPLIETSGILALIAGLSVLISCLGLLGIAMYSVQTRIREIGIRKALGATVSSVVGLLSKDFLRLIGIAVALGVPVAWWFNQLWLQVFAYRIDLGVWTFLLSWGPWPLSLSDRKPSAPPALTRRRRCGMSESIVECRLENW